MHPYKSLLIAHYSPTTPYYSPTIPYDYPTKPYYSPTGASAMQIMGGLFGAIIIEPSGLENIPSSITDSDNHLIVISDMILIQETRDGAVTQGCANDTPCDPTSQAPLCTGSEQSSPFNPFR